jgi:hypothetical protein
MTDELRLRGNEQLLWSGAPDPSVTFTRADGFLVPFTVVWASFAIFWEATAIAANAPIPMLLFGGLFVLLGVYFVIGRFVVKRTTKRNTRYHLTTRRAITVGPGGRADIAVDAYALRTVRSRNGDHIDVIFGTRWGPMTGMPGFSILNLYSNTGLDFFTRLGPGSSFAFYDVPDVEGLESALATLRGEAEGATSGPSGSTAA